MSALANSQNFPRIVETDYLPDGLQLDAALQQVQISLDNLACSFSGTKLPQSSDGSDTVPLREGLIVFLRVDSWTRTPGDGKVFAGKRHYFFDGDDWVELAPSVDLSGALTAGRLEGNVIILAASGGDLRIDLTPFRTRTVAAVQEFTAKTARVDAATGNLQLFTEDGNAVAGANGANIPARNDLNAWVRNRTIGYAPLFAEFGPSSDNASFLLSGTNTYDVSTPLATAVGNADFLHILVESNSSRDAFSPAVRRLGAGFLPFIGTAQPSFAGAGNNIQEFRVRSSGTFTVEFQSSGDNRTAKILGLKIL